MVERAGHFHVPHVSQPPGADTLGQQQPALSVGFAVGVAVAGEFIQEGLGHGLALDQRHQRVPAADPVGDGIERHRLEIGRRRDGEPAAQRVAERGGDNHAPLGVDGVGIGTGETQKRQ